MPDSVIEKIICTATYAPSAHNRQPWRFVVVTTSVVKSRLAEAMATDFEHDLLEDGVAPDQIKAQITRSKERVTAAPVIVLLSFDMSDMNMYPDEKRQHAERTMAIQSVAAAGLQLLLAAHAEGLGGAWICAPLFAQETIRKTLELPEMWEPQAMYYLGYPDGSPKSKEMKELNTLIKRF